MMSKFHNEVEITVEKRPFSSNKFPVSVIGQGTWYGDRNRRSVAFAALRAGLDLGMSHIDTAEMCSSGAAEEWIAEAIAGRSDEVFMVSKVLPENSSARGTIAACERSLARLRIGHLDGYLLRWRGSHPLAETVAAFEKLRGSGKIVWWGVSNFDIEDLQGLRDLAGAGHPACNQVLYHLREHAIEHRVVERCRENGPAVVA